MSYCREVREVAVKGKCPTCDSDQYEVLDKGEPGVDGWGTPIRQCRICSTIYQRRNL